MSTTPTITPPAVEEKKPVVADDPKIGLALHDLDAKNAAAISTNPIPKEERNAETDAYITKQKEEKFEKRKKRGGVRERIDQLTKETDEAKKEAAEAKKEAEDARKAAEEAKAKPAVVQAAPVDDPGKPDPRPKREDFTDEGEFTAKIAEWVVRQQNKIKPLALADTKDRPDTADKNAAEVSGEVKFDPANPEHVKLKADFDGFLETGREYIKTHPDFNDRLNDAAKRGLTLDNAAQRAIITLKSPEVLYYLASPENESAARAIMKKSAVEQVVEIGLLYDKLQVKPSDFVSSAGKPGIRLTNGNTRSTIPISEMDTDDYIRQRREDIKAGRRRRYR